MAKIIMAIYVTALIYGCVNLNTSNGDGNATGEHRTAKAKVDSEIDMELTGVELNGK